ncbi:MAG: hypothetical protein NT165_01475 [Candidatus Falkowbacteria bacterium]|nr:hypothetical protein [Candidatus Falkowbacteria bacterium]
MKKKTIVSGALALLALASVSSIALPVMAATDSSSPTTVKVGKEGKHQQFGQNKNLTASQKTAIDQKIAAKKAATTQAKAEIQAALTAGDYNAWVTAEKKYHGDKAPILSQVTSANFAKFAEAKSYLERGRAMMIELGIKGEMPGFQK